MSPIRHTLIMAAGRGQRMMPATDVLPKAMLPYLESTLIAHGIDKVRPHIENIHITVGYKGAMLAAHLIEHGVTTILNTDGKPNGWWLTKSLMRHLDEPMFVLTCDNVTDIDFAELAAEYDALGRPPCLLVPVEPVAGLEGDYIFHDGPVVTRLSRTETAPIYASGIQVLHPARVVELIDGADDFAAIWAQLIAQRQLFVSSVRPRRWYSCDTIEHLDQAVARFQGA